MVKQLFHRYDMTLPNDLEDVVEMCSSDNEMRTSTFVNNLNDSSSGLTPKMGSLTLGERKKYLDSFLSQPLADRSSPTKQIVGFSSMPTSLP